MTAQVEATETGTVSGIENHGTIVLVNVRADNGRMVSIPFDHSPFRWMLDGEQCSPADLIGRNIAHDGEFLIFLDSPK